MEKIRSTKRGTLVQRIEREKSLHQADANNNPDESLTNYMLLDVSIGSDNEGDHIIMESCDRIFRKIVENKNDTRIVNVPTHYYTPDLDERGISKRLLCGTNIIYTHMEEQEQWALSKNLKAFNNLCLFGVGMNESRINESFSMYPKRLLKRMLNNGSIHSTRDELTASKLRSIGICNVVNTACPTMWSHTHEHLKSIPVRKGKIVVTSITDYCFDAPKDGLLLSILKQEYDRVVLWAQGSKDVEFLNAHVPQFQGVDVITPPLRYLNDFIELEFSNQVQFC